MPQDKGIVIYLLQRRNTTGANLANHLVQAEAQNSKYMDRIATALEALLDTQKEISISLSTIAENLSNENRYDITFFLNMHSIFILNINHLNTVLKSSFRRISPASVNSSEGSQLEVSISSHSEM